MEWVGNVGFALIPTQSTVGEGFHALPAWVE